MKEGICKTYKLRMGSSHIIPICSLKWHTTFLKMTAQWKYYKKTYTARSQDIEVDNQDMKQFSTSIVFREIKIKN